jgi:hypothetical protein
LSSEYLKIKSLFYDNESILEGMRVLRDTDENVFNATVSEIWRGYVNKTHGNDQQISFDLAQNPDLIECLPIWNRNLLFAPFNNDLFGLQKHTDFKKKNHWKADSESVLEEGSYVFSKNNFNINKANALLYHLVVIDRVLNSDRNNEEKTALRKEVLKFFPENVKFVDIIDNSGQARYDLNGRNAHLYMINMICQGEEFPDFYINKILKTSGKTKLFDNSEEWFGSENGEQSPLRVAWLLSTWRKQTVSERTILRSDEIHHQDAVEKFRKMVLQSPAHYLDKGKFVQENHRSILEKLTILETFLDPDFDVDFTTDEGLRKVYRLAKAIKDLLNTYSEDEEMCNFLKTIRGPKDPRTFEQRSLPDVDSDNQKRILQALRSNPSGLTSDELRERASVSRPRRSINAMTSYIDEIDDRFTLKNEFLPPFKGLSVYIHEKLTNKPFVQHLLEHIETLEPSNTSYYVQILYDFDLFLEPESEYLVGIRRKNFKLLFRISKDYLTKANDLPDEEQKLERIKMFKRILWEENPFNRVWVEKDTYHQTMVDWTRCCIEINLAKELAKIDFRTYEKLMKRNREWGEPSFSVYSSNYLSKVARFLLEQ